MIMNLNMKPILKNSYNFEKMQPSYSTFLVKTGDRVMPINVNKTGSDILRMCNGKNEISEIINSQVEKYGEEFKKEKKFVTEFLEDMHNKNVIDFNDSFTQIENIQYGSREYWTPNNINIEITNACELRCKNCFVEADMGKNPKYLDDDVFYNVLFDMKSMNIENIQFSGGEPLLHKSFFNYVNKAVELGIMCHISTSGYIYNEDVINSFRKISDLDKIVLQVSIDGLEEYHDDFRGVKGAYKNSMGFIDSMIKLGVSVNVACQIYSQSYDEIKSLAKLLKDKGVRTLQITPASNRVRTSENLRYSEMKECTQISEIVSKLKYEFEDADFRIVESKEDLIGRSNATLKNCGLGQTKLKIDAYGKVYPCAKSNMVIGNVCEETITSIQMRNSTLFEKMVAPNKRSCGGCNNKSMCSECIIQGLSVNETSTIPCKWYDSQMELINEIRTVNGLKVKFSPDQKMDSYLSMTMRDIEAIKNVILRTYTKEIKDVS